MKVNTEEKYLQKILDKFKKEQEESDNDYLLRPTPSNLKKLLIDVFSEEGHLSDNDELIIRVFLNLKETDDILLSIKNSDTETYKSVQNFLTGKTKKVNRFGLPDLIALLVDFNPRPYRDFKKHKLDNKSNIVNIHEIEGSEGDSVNQKKHKNKFMFFIICLISIGLLLLYFLSNLQLNKTEKPNKKSINYSKDSIRLKKEQNENIKTKNQPPKKIIETNKLGVFIFDSVNTLDDSVSNKIKKYYSKQYSIKHKTLPYTEIQQLHKGNVNPKLSKYFDFICLGKIEYSFRKNTINTKIITCDLNIHYSIISIDSGELVDTFSESFIGIGSSKNSSKINTIKKIKL